MRDKAWVQRRFDQEVTALQQIRHPNVIPIYAKGTSPSGSPYLVMEFVEGRNLRAVLEAGALPPVRAARLLRQLADALEAMHSKSIWHRDVKPENIMIRNEGAPNEEPVLIDFSIAIVKDADETLHGLSRAAGTFDYMAPEQAIGYARAARGSVRIPWFQSVGCTYGYPRRCPSGNRHPEILNRVNLHRE